MFFSFDGIDGVGKSTQIGLFADWLRQAGHDVVTCRDPGGTELGEAVRQILLNDFATPIGRRSEMLLYMASRAQLVDQVIRPALDRMPLDKARLRIARELDRMEQQDDSFRERLRAGFLAEAARKPERIAVIDASGPPEQVQGLIRRAAQASKVGQALA
ncbi:MAG: thymidylate kinase [Planctomycetes bacterium]|nr:thymidylate kinase [Planctomycetota bacterium]